MLLLFVVVVLYCSPSIFFSLPFPNKLQRFTSNQHHFRREPSIAHPLASHIKKAVSLDFTDGGVGGSFEDYIQGTEDDTDPFDEEVPRTARVTQTHVHSSEDDDESRGTKRRKGSDLTPGDFVLGNAMPMLEQHCRVDENKGFMPFFPPGRMLHLQVKKSER